MNNDISGFDKAQRQYDNQLPPEGPEPVICDTCDGNGTVFDDGAPDRIPIPCPKCKGEGEIIPEPDEDTNWDDYPDFDDYYDTYD